ncbi:MAG: cytochrome-c peroxidase [Poseidonibacter sp.]|uniref:cytochrome-c peroxidase n=1 Tax=Poseidonibacter sp. TaxID=2321188 RepID=UPI00359DCCDE
MIFILFTTLNSIELITAIPNTNDYNNDKALLGKMLFFDKRLSHNNTISCASCHNISKGGDDDLALPFGIYQKKGTRNSPTVLNAKFNEIQFWDGRAKSLQAQASGPIHNPVEMDSNFDEIISKLKKDKQFSKKFLLTYPDGFSEYNITNAISEFEKTLTTPNSRFDKFLKGNKSALNDKEMKGYQTFKEYGCISCHNGVNIGGNLIQKIGIVDTYYTDDLGRFYVTKDENDKFYFKVPTLRNIDLTAPYFHNGEVKTLKEAVEKMLKYQIGYLLEDEEIENIVLFLKTLNGETPKFMKDTENEKIYN